jgi:hypothetical protein
MAWPKFGHVIYFLFWHKLFPFSVKERDGLQDLIQIKGCHVPGFFFLHALAARGKFSYWDQKIVF